MPQDIINPFIPVLLIGWCNRNHYILILPKNYDIYYNAIKIDIPDITYENSKSIKIKKKNTQNKKIKNNYENNKNEIIDDSKKKKESSNDNKFKKFLTIFFKINALFIQK
jgi:hypothetical protein